MSVFGAYSRYYNLLYKDKDYSKEAEHVHGLITKYRPHAKSILDLGCGDGALTEKIAASGAWVVGADLSRDLVTATHARGLPAVIADGRALCRAIRARGKVDPIFLEDVNTLPQALTDVLRGNDVLLTMGAGSIGGVSASLPRMLSKGSNE